MCIRDSLYILYLIFIITLPQDVFSLFGTCFGTLSVPIISLPNFESCGVLVCWLVGFMAVSYTHLDVYKRQNILCNGRNNI